MSLPSLPAEPSSTSSAGGMLAVAASTTPARVVPTQSMPTGLAVEDVAIPRGAAKALLFLVSIDEKVATSVLGRMSIDEVRAIREASEALEEIDPRVILAIHRDFIGAIQSGVPTSLRGSGAYLRRLAGKALGEHRAADIWDGSQREVSPTLTGLAELDPERLLPMLEREHPQTLAVVLALLDAKKGAAVLGRLPVDVQIDVVRRAAGLKAVPVSVVRDIETQLSQEVAALGEVERREIDGLAVATDLLKQLGEQRAESILEELADADAELAQEVRKALFTFEDLRRLEGRAVQALLKEIATEQLTLALKTASPELREKIFANVSSRAAANLREELELMGPVRVSDVEEAQRAIVDTALRLERDGVITIAREGSGELV